MSEAQLGGDLLVDANDVVHQRAVARLAAVRRGAVTNQALSRVAPPPRGEERFDTLCRRRQRHFRHVHLRQLKKPLPAVVCLPLPPLLLPPSRWRTR